MYVTLFCETLIYLRMFFSYPQSCELSEYINMYIYIIEKSKKKRKTVSQLYLKLYNNILNNWLTTQFNDGNALCTI